MEEKLEKDEIKKILEALFFASGEDIKLDEICNVLEISEDYAQEVLDEMIVEKNIENAPILLVKIDKSYQLCTNHIYGDYLAKLLDKRPNPKLTKSSMEVLSIIAYNENITRAKIEEIRGVASDSIVTRLIDYGLIKESGKQDMPGRPMGYITTEKFLLTFGLKDKSELPKINSDNIQGGNIENE